MILPWLVASPLSQRCRWSCGSQLRESSPLKRGSWAEPLFLLENCIGSIGLSNQAFFAVELKAKVLLDKISFYMWHIRDQAYDMCFLFPTSCNRIKVLDTGSRCFSVLWWHVRQSQCRFRPHVFVGDWLGGPFVPRPFWCFLGSCQLLQIFQVSHLSHCKKQPGKWLQWLKGSVVLSSPLGFMMFRALHAVYFLHDAMQYGATLFNFLYKETLFNFIQREERWIYISSQVCCVMHSPRGAFLWHHPLGIVLPCPWPFLLLPWNSSPPPGRGHRERQGRGLAGNEWNFVLGEHCTL